MEGPLCESITKALCGSISHNLFNPMGLVAHREQKSNHLIIKDESKLV